MQRLAWLRLDSGMGFANPLSIRINPQAIQINVNRHLASALGAGAEVGS